MTRYFVPRCFDVHRKAPSLNGRNCLLGVSMLLENCPWLNFIHSFIHSFFHSFMHSFIHSFIHWHSESSSAVTLLLHADWMMQTTWPLLLCSRNPVLGCWSLRKLIFSKTIRWIFDWMPREEPPTFQNIWSLIWKPGDWNFWVKICLALERSKMSFPPSTPSYNVL